MKVAAALLVLCSWKAGALRFAAVEEAITTEGLRHSLQVLADIAAANSNNRAFGTPGYKASVDYVLSRLRGDAAVAAVFETTVQPFNHTFQQTRNISLTANTGPGGTSEPIRVVSPMYNTNTPLPGGITAPLLDTPVDDERGSMCFEDQWSGIDATNKIVLVKRGVCAVSDKAKLARAHGAIAMILYNQSSGTSISIPTLGSDNYGKLIPIGIVPLEVGTAWKERLQSAPGEDLTVTLVVDAIVEPRETWNVLAETKAGDPNAVIMLGAHLDSVQAGPGINDDASGSVALLEIASALASSVGVASRNKIRLAWWGAEESGLVGSLYYTTTLAPEEADRIRFYFNYDMIGSIVPSYRVYQSNAGDSAGAAPLLLHLQEQGKNASYGRFGTSSDYVGFIDLGIPASGIFTGAGTPADPCYHRLCDDMTNINWDALTASTRAAASVALELAAAEPATGLPPRRRTSTPRGGRGSPRRRHRDIFSRTRADEIVLEKIHRDDEGHACGMHEETGNTV